VWLKIGSVERFHITADKAFRFIEKVASAYQNENKYHTFYHAVDVMQTMYMFMRTIKAQDFISVLDIWACMIAAIGHDVGHPGVNANFLIATRSKLAMTYNDTSVLENMHASTLYKMMHENDEVNVLKGLSASEWVDARRCIVQAILATDMVHHFKMVNDVEVFFELNEERLANKSERIQVLRSAANSQFIINVLLHSADISNPVKKYSVYEKWATVVMEEFFLQGDRERRMGMPVSAMFDRHTTNIQQMQVNFIEFVVGPLYAGLIRIFPGLHQLGSQLVSNRTEMGQKWMLHLKATSSETDYEGELEKK